MDGHECERTERLETCMMFRDWADHYIAIGAGRPISEEEAIEILEHNQKEGLVLMPSNSQEAQFVCSCCPDCCGGLRTLRSLERPAERALTKYQAAVTSDLCIACDACVEMCPMDAISTESGTAVIDEARCIGCGVCVTQCESEAIHLRPTGKKLDTPKSLDDLYETYYRINQEAT